MKKYAAVVLLTVLLLATCAPAPGAGQPAACFSNLAQSDWYYPYVQDLCRLGVFSGRGGTFDSGSSVTWREAFGTILLASGHSVSELNGDSEWIGAAVKHRLVYSFSARYLDEPTTRRNVARMTARAFQLTGISGPSPFADCDDGYVTQLYEKGLLRDERDESGRLIFRPNEPMTRAELAVFLWHAVRDDFRAGMFRYNNYWLDELEGVPRSPFAPEQFAQGEDGRVSYSGGYYALGVDVSGFQGDIDWEAVAADGVDFAIIRVGGRFIQSGELYDDSYLQKNLEGALAAGLDVGVYFFSQAVTPEEAAEEADYVLERIRGYDLTYPVVFDWEYLMGSEGRTYGVDPAVITRCASTFCSRIAEAGYRPMIYFNTYCGYVKMNLSELAQYDFWYAEYTGAPSCIYGFQMWQYSNCGQVAGIPAQVDMNLCFVPYGAQDGCAVETAGRDWPTVLI